MSRFLDGFRQHFAASTDAPAEFGEAAGLMVLSTIALGRRWLNYGSGIRPNLFMMVAGDSSVARKSTSVEIAQKFVAEVDEQRIGPRDYTVEGLIRWMQEKDPSTNKARNKVTLFAEEFGQDLARMEAYASTMPADFCALYDGGTFEKARARAGIIRIDKPRVGLFAAAAYHMLQRYLKPRDWLSGYLMRFVYVTPRTMRPAYLLQPTVNVNDFKRLSIQLKILRDDLQRHHHALELDPHAKAYYAQVMAQFDAFTATATGAAGSAIMSTYKARFRVHLLKLALLYQLDIDPGANVGAQAMQSAISFGFDICWPSFQQAYFKTAMNDFDNLFVAVLGQLQQPMTRSQLAQQFIGNAQLTGVVKYLEMHHLVSATKNGNAEYLQAVVAPPKQ